MSQPPEAASREGQDSPPAPAPQEEPDVVWAATGEDAPGRHRVRSRYGDLRQRADRTGKAVAAKAEDLRVRRASVRTAYRAYEYDRRHGGALLAGGLAYRFFIWLLPAALFLASIASIFGQVFDSNPADAARSAGLSAALAVTIGKAAAETGKEAWFLVFFGLALMLWAGMSAWKALRLVSSVAWGVRLTAARHQVRNAVVFCGVGVAMLFSPLLFHLLASGPFYTDILGVVVVVVGLAALALWFMLSLPHPEGIRWTSFLPGAVLFGVGIEILKIVTQIYFVARVGRSELYGALGLAAIFMAWLYLVGRIVVGGLALNATRWYERNPAGSPPGAPSGDLPPPSPGGGGAPAA
ncbi:MAG TPA: YhjD/YihY/BrkB family envelope integrity protein [Actinomycetota bacterium]|nr:YhjD/YihY/BrkB family envelope integrity protein [Actinomycetota bacterium]